MFACKSNKEFSTEKIEKVYELMYWEEELIQLESASNTLSEYLVYSLNEAAFYASLSEDTIFIPDLNSGLAAFAIEKTETMSPELAEKFPEIQTYKGTQLDNPLCEARITFKGNLPDISVQCNDLTYFIKKSKNEDYYVVYNKQAVKNSLSE